MYVKKIRFFDFTVDDFKDSLGKGLTRRGNKLVEEQPNAPLKIRYRRPTYRTNSDNLLEKTQKFSILVSQEEAEDFDPSTANRTYHYGNLIAPELRNTIAINDDSKAVSAGYVAAKFNFVSEQYEKFSQSKEETQLPCIYLESDPLQTETIQDLKFFPRTIPKARYFYDLAE